MNMWAGLAPWGALKEGLSAAGLAPASRGSRHPSVCTSSFPSGPSPRGLHSCLGVQAPLPSLMNTPAIAFRAHSKSGCLRPKIHNRSHLHRPVSKPGHSLRFCVHVSFAGTLFHPLQQVMLAVGVPRPCAHGGGGVRCGSGL